MKKTQGIVLPDPLMTFFEQTPTGVLIWKKEQLCYFNHSAKNILPFLNSEEEITWAGFKKFLLDDSTINKVEHLLNGFNAKTAFSETSLFFPRTQFYWDKKVFLLQLRAYTFELNKYDLFTCILIQPLIEKSTKKSLNYEQIYSSFTENTQDLIFILDTEGFILFSNNKAQEIFSFLGKNPVGENFSLLTENPGIKPFFIEPVLKKEKNIFLLKKTLAPGEEIHLSINCIAMQQNSNLAPFILVIGRDISTLIEYQDMLLQNIKEQNIQKEILQLLLKAPGISNAFNGVFEGIATNNKIIGLIYLEDGISKFFKGESSNSFLDYNFFSSLEQKEVVFRVFLSNTKDKHITASANEQNLFNILSSLFYTIERFKIIKAYKKSKEKAEESDRLKAEFLSNISHEIKTPLNGIMGFLQLLEQTNLQNDQKEYVALILKSGKRLLKLLSDLIDLSDIESKEDKLEKKWFNFPEFLAKLLKPYKEKIDLKQISYSENFLNIPEKIFHDEEKLRMILENLLSNAIKFTLKGSISLEIFSEMHELHFIIKDSGIGIPKEKQPLIFKKFVQADGSNTRKFGGTGLGLSIVKAILDKMGGSVSFTSETEKGSSFHISVPIGLDE